MIKVQPADISVITVCYNAVANIERCVRSVVQQSYPHIEYIVIDGGSSDGTLGVLEKYRDRIAVLVSEPDGGIYPAMNKGLARATGDLVYFINADDYLVDERVIADVVAYVKTHAAGDVYYGSIELRQAGGTIGVYAPEGPQKAAEIMVCGCLPHQATFARRQVFERTGPFNESYRYHADYDWFLKVIADPGIQLVRIPRVVASYRLGGASSHLAQGQPEAYRIQNASPLYASEGWSERRIGIYQATLLATRIENADLKASLSAPDPAGRAGKAAARVLAIRHAVARRLTAGTRRMKATLRSLRELVGSKRTLPGR
jgi:glycosyltransferase involved in cell wall biosynthesis